MMSLKLDNTFIAEVAAKAAVLETAEGASEILRCGSVVVQICVASLKLARDRQRPVTIFCPH